MAFKDMPEADSAPLGALKDTQLLEHGTARCGRCNAAVAPPGFGTAQYLDEGLFQLPKGLGMDGENDVFPLLQMGLRGSVWVQSGVFG